MKKPRSLDLDGLDGIIPSSDSISSTPFWQKGLWFLLLIGLMAIALLWLQKRWNSPVSSPMVLELEQPVEDKTIEPRNNAAEEVLSSVPMKREDQAEQASATASVESHQSFEEELKLPVEPTAAGYPAATAAGALYTVNFKFNSSEPAQLSEAEVVDLLKRVVSCRIGIRVAGNTCNLGNDEVNQRLGLARAEAVKKLLLANGITAQRIEIVSEGKNNPIAPNDTAFGRALNRRVELSCLDR